MKKILLIVLFCLTLTSALTISWQLFKNKNINKASAIAESNSQNIDSDLTITNADPKDTFGFFASYTSWPSSRRLKDNDSLRWIIEMMVVSKTDITDTFLTASQFVDLNGDGLNDYLYFYYRPNMSGIGERGYIALQNTGNNNFDLIYYKCYWYKDNSVNIVYGDCADTSYDPAYYENMPFVKTYFPSYKLIYNLYDLTPQYGDSQGGANELSEQNNRYFYDGHFEPSFFMDHRKWKNSVSPMIDNRLKLLTSLNTAGWPGTQPGYNFSQRSVQFTDINSDGLIDVLSFYVNMNLVNYCTRNMESITESAILLNQGNFKFTPIYKCYQGDKCNPLGSYYGDCAQ